MEIPAWLFFSFWSVMSFAFLHLGFYALDKTELSSSVSPIIMSLFKHSLAISSCCSSNYALIFRPHSTDDIDGLYLWAVCESLIVLNFRFVEWTFLKEHLLWGLLLCILIRFFAWLLDFFLPKFKIFSDRYSLVMVFFFFPTPSFPWFIFIPFLTLINYYVTTGQFEIIGELKTRIAVIMAVQTTLFFVRGENTHFFPFLVLFVSFFISAFWTALCGFEPFARVSWSSGDELFNEFLPVAMIMKEKKMGKLFGFGVGMVGTILFQYFFRLTSFNHVVAFLYLAVMWVANLAMLGVSSDFGVLNFLLGNVVVGCTVSQFGIQSTTWFAYGACLLLYGLRLKLESFTLLYRQGQHVQVELWSESFSRLPV